MTVKECALEALREHRSIVAHYPEDKAAKGLVAFLGLFELEDKGLTSDKAEDIIRRIHDLTQDQFDGKRPWPIGMTEDLLTINRSVVDVLKAVLG